MNIQKISKIRNKGKIFVLSSPSGGGKTTLAQQLLETTSNMVRSISMTTRAPRNGEQDKIDYHFVTNKEFLDLVKKDGFLEYANVFDQYYGTPKAFVEKNQNKGKDILLLIDVQGAEQIRRHCREAILIFIMPPSMSVLQDRLKNRSTDTDHEIKKRLEVAKDEISQAKLYDYIVINSNLKQAEKDLKAIITAERLKNK